MVTLSSSTRDGDDGDPSQQKGLRFISEDNIGLAALLTVPVVWGTYVPLVRLLYSIDPPIPGFVFSVAYFSLASVTTLGLLFSSNDTEENSLDFPIAGGLELGSYLFLGNCLQVVGLETVSADKAGFLVQLTTILVPILSSVGNFAAVSLRTWFACAIALLGISVMQLKVLIPVDLVTATSFNDIISFPSIGEGLILAAAVCYSLHVIRLGYYAKSTTPLKLTAAKSSVETVWSILLVVFLVTIASAGGSEPARGVTGFLQQQGNEIVSFFENVVDRVHTGTLEKETVFKASLATLWAGWVSTAYVVAAQSFGQQRVTNPAQANLIYSLQPIFTAVFAYFLLGESMESTGVIGGGLILVAVLVVASAQPGTEREKGAPLS